MDTPIGVLELVEENGFLISLSLEHYTDVVIEETEVLKKCALELSEYFLKKRRIFDIPICLKGSEFQRSVWETLMEIPYGEVCSYQDVAIKIGKPKTSRAIGMANHNNPILIIVPCHRVIGKSGDLSGYALGVDCKKYLLDLERE